MWFFLSKLICDCHSVQPLSISHWFHEGKRTMKEPCFLIVFMKMGKGGWHNAENTYILQYICQCSLPQSTMAPYICHPLPLITAQIEFELKSSPALSTITSCMEFGPEWLLLRRGRENGPTINCNQHLQLEDQPPIQSHHKQETPPRVRSLGKASSICWRIRKQPIQLIWI